MYLDSEDEEKKDFICPHCKVYAIHHWLNQDLVDDFDYKFEEHLNLSQCSHCGKPVIWFDNKMIFPLTNNAPKPAKDLKGKALQYYKEASQVSLFSPIASCALLRLTIETIVNDLVKGSDDLNYKIGVLVENGLSEIIQKSLDSLRVIGNFAVHSGVLILSDNDKNEELLFNLVNTIIVDRITNKNNIRSIYDKLPDSQKDAIDKRDNKNKTK